MAGPARSGSRHTILRAIFLTAAIFSAILASDIWTPASAQTTGTDSPVSVEVLPTEATFQPGDVMTFELLIENTSATPVNVSAVDVLLPSRVALAGPPPAAPGTVQPASAFTEKFDVRAGLGSDSGQVVVVAQFQSTSGDPGFAHGAVQLSPGK